MAKRYKLYSIKTIKNWQNEDWDVYEERKSPVGLILNFGWLYGAPRTGSKSFILTSELVEYFKTVTYREAIDQLGLSSTTVGRIRRELNLQKVVARRDRNWIIQHQNEILYYSFPMLLEKYGLRKGIVKSYSNYLVHKVGVRRRTTRHHESQFLVEKIYHVNKEKIAKCQNFKELNHILQTDDYTARKFHELACAELNIAAMSEIHLKHLSETWQWRYQHRDTILNPKMSIEQIAVQLNTTMDDIYNARKALRRRLNIQETIGVVREVDIEAWVLEHATELRNLTSSQLHQKYQLSKGQVKYRRMLLKNLQQKMAQNVGV